MGFFSEIASEARRNSGSGLPAQPIVQDTPVQRAVSSQGASAIPAPAAPEPKPTPDPAEPAPAPAQQPVIDLTAEAAGETERRKAHEAAEAKRKAEFDAKQAEKNAARQAALNKIKAMNDTELLAAATGRVAADTERLTRRNMKEAVAEHIQARCQEDAALSLLVMDPEKSMVNCFQYINRKAREYAEQEMKDNGIERTGVYGLDVSDGLCCQWAEEYFNDPDAKEDHKDDEKFIPKPYVPATRKSAKAKTGKKSETKKPATDKPAKAPVATMEQISLM